LEFKGIEVNMGVSARSRILLPDWSYTVAQDVKIGQEVMGYTKVDDGSFQLVPTKVLKADLYTDTIYGQRHQTFRITFVHDGFGLRNQSTTIVCGRDQKIWQDRLRNGKVWKVPARRGVDVDYTRASLLREGHLLRGIGQNCFPPDNTEEWKIGYNFGVLSDTSQGDPSQIGPASSNEIARGYLAGIFDTIGQIGSQSCLVITPHRWLSRNLIDCFHRLSIAYFDDVVDSKYRVRVNGDMQYQMQFLVSLGLKTDSRKREMRKRGLTGCRAQIATIEEGSSSSTIELVTEVNNYLAEGIVFKSPKI
jgi:hypothetical protein